VVGRRTTSRAQTRRRHSTTRLCFADAWRPDARRQRSAEDARRQQAAAGKQVWFLQVFTEEPVTERARAPSESGRALQVRAGAGAK